MGWIPVKQQQEGGKERFILWERIEKYWFNMKTFKMEMIFSNISVTYPDFAFEQWYIAPVYGSNA